MGVGLGAAAEGGFGSASTCTACPPLRPPSGAGTVAGAGSPGKAPAERSAAAAGPALPRLHLLRLCSRGGGGRCRRWSGAKLHVIFHYLH